MEDLYKPVFYRTRNCHVTQKNETKWGGGRFGVNATSLTGVTELCCKSTSSKHLSGSQGTEVTKDLIQVTVFYWLNPLVMCPRCKHAS